MKNTFTIAAALAASTSMVAASNPDDNCCTVWDGEGYWGHNATYCLDLNAGATERQAAFTVALWYDIWDNGSIKCGKNVDATICPHGFEYGGVDGQREFGYKCATDSIHQEHGFQVGAGEHVSKIEVTNQQSSIIVSLHPWEAKGAKYLSLDRDWKEWVLWNKIISDPTINEAAPAEEFFNIDLSGVFDEFGDEFDCRVKTAHPQGNVGKAEWIDLGGHPYTGIFEGGADTGFVRLSTQSQIVTPTEREWEGQNVMMPTIAVKFLRDGMDSANSQANQNISGGQPSYDFFASSLHTNLGEFLAEGELLTGDICQVIAPETPFCASLGSSEMATYTQDGVKVANPVFPYSLRYEPNAALSYDDEDYTMSVFEHLSGIAEGTILYKVYAKDAPTSLGGQELLIGEIVLRSELKTSKWGDEHMFFRHQRHDDDMRSNPAWIPKTNVFLLTNEELQLREDLQLHPYQEKKMSSCPFSFLFETFQKY